MIVTRHYPPVVSGGARRPSLLAAGLRERGWRVLIATPVRPVDGGEWIETPHPAGVRGDAALGASMRRRDGIPEKAKAALRTALYWPDGDMRWAISAAHRIMSSGIRPDWVVSTSPPESAHLAGRLVQKGTGARWLAEFRDSWIDDPLRPELRASRVRRSLERVMARRLISKADATVAVSEAIAGEIARYRSDHRAPDVIGHFARRSDSTFRFDGPGPHFLHTGRFTLSHPERQVGRVLAGFETALAQAPNAQLHLVGLLTDEEMRLVQSHPLAASVRLHGEAPHDVALAMQAAADALILYQPETAALPGKLSEYLLAEAPILIVGEGPWVERLAETPHFPIGQAQAALAACKRTPADTATAALDAYERIFLGLNSGPGTEARSASGEIAGREPM